MSPPERTLQLVAGAAGIRDAPAESSFRLRPGERATWIDVSAAETELREWRRQGATAGLSVDVCIALKLEWSLVRADIPESAKLAAVVDQARAETAAPRLAPSDELRRWVAFLCRGPQPHAENDLPSIALPARVVARVAPAMLAREVRDRANDILGADAVVVECAASLSGMTMESWAYRAFARLE